MADSIETINGSVIQHGHHNDRIYLMRLNLDDIETLLVKLDELARDKGYGKVLARISSNAWPDFRTAGYRKEAVVPGFYRGRMDGLFVARYFSTHRQELPPIETRDTIRAIIDNKPPADSTGTDRPQQPIVACGPGDTDAMSAVYRRVFKSYPFPIHKPDYLNHVMKAGVSYYCIRAGDQITALAATEIDWDCKVSEMTDFATLPEWQKHGLADALLKHMESAVRKQEIRTAYTIARAASPGINRIFKNNGYHYAGLLKNNTQICGSIQSMTVWYKQF